MRIANAIEKMKRYYRQMNLFDKLLADVKNQVQNVIIDQNKWLKVIMEDPSSLGNEYPPHEHESA